MLKKKYSQSILSSHCLHTMNHFYNLSCINKRLQHVIDSYKYANCIEHIMPVPTVIRKISFHSFEGPRKEMDVQSKLKEKPRIV